MNASHEFVLPSQHPAEPNGIVFCSELRDHEGLRRSMSRLCRDYRGRLIRPPHA